MKWLKEWIKEDVIAFLLLCFLLGTAFIWSAGHFRLVNLSDGEKVNATVLWLTALAIFWYAYETYQLKKNTSEQVNIQEEIMLNEFLPILEPGKKGGGAVLRNGQLSGFVVSNLGKGPAKYIQIYIGKFKFDLSISISAGQSEEVRVPSAASKEIGDWQKQNHDKIRMVITYQDIYQRRFQSNNIYFDKIQEKSGYQLRSSSWDFKRLRK